MDEWVEYEDAELESPCVLTCGSKPFPPICVTCERSASGSTPRHPRDYREGPGNPKNITIRPLKIVMHVNKLSSKAELRWP